MAWNAIERVVSVEAGMQEAATWSVMTVTRNTAFELLRFLSWHFDQGAAKGHVIFHRPDDPNLSLVQDHPHVFPILLTNELQNEMGLNDASIGKLQDRAGTFIYPRVKEDWLLRIDCDELMYCGTGTIGESLALVAEDRKTVVVRPAENVAQSADLSTSYFRLPMDEGQLEAVYGDFAPLMKKRGGLIGHLFGKSFHRTGIPNLLVGEHNAIYADSRTRTLNVKNTAKSNFFLLHFNSTDYAIWRERLEFRTGGSSFPPHFTAKVREILNQPAGKEDALLKLHHKTCVFDKERREQLMELGCGLTLQFDFDALVKSHFPDN